MMTDEQPIDHRRNWVIGGDGEPVPRRTSGTRARYSQSDFTLVCEYCGDDYGNEPDLPVGVVAAHFEKWHPDQPVNLMMLWLGQGPGPWPQKS